MFSLFLAFSASDIYQRSRDLNLAVQREVSVARSIFKFSEALGSMADPVRDALIEYLQAVTTLEEGWLEGTSISESPAQDTVDTLVQVSTLFVVQSAAPPALKSLIVNNVETLRQARTERITQSRKSSGLPQWIMLTLVASVTQLVIALGYVGKPNAQRATVLCFTFVVMSALTYLGWIDGLVGPQKIAASLQPLTDLLQATVSAAP
jgi:hypothetical protein